VKHYNKMARQAGMTLIELTVVLLVLIGLAGLMIPYVSGFVSKTHDATGSDSLASLNSAIQRYDVQYMGQPSGYDSLVTDITANNAVVYTKLMNGDVAESGNLDAEDYMKKVNIPASALTGVGIDSLMLMDSSTDDATFAATSSSIAVPTAMSTMISVVALKTQGGVACASDAPMGCISSDADLSAILGHSVDTNAKDYIIFGVGSETTMVGKTISEAPVHFAKTGAMSAANKYNRILAVYEVPKGSYCDGGTRLDLAVAPIDSTECETANPAGPMTAAGTWETVTMMNRQAKFLTTAMPMMRLEGLSGALASHYSSVDN